MEQDIWEFQQHPSHNHRKYFCWGLFLISTHSNAVLWKAKKNCFMINTFLTGWWSFFSYDLSVSCRWWLNKSVLRWAQLKVKRVDLVRCAEVKVILPKVYWSVMTPWNNVAVENLTYKVIGDCVQTCSEVIKHI